MEVFKKYLKRNGLTAKAHQSTGITWCKKIETEGKDMNGTVVHSGLLADEMGLGKTIQMIGLMLENFKLHSLIVVPRGLLEQWDTTIKTSLGHQAMVYHGKNKKLTTKERVFNSPIVLTTYGQLKDKLLHEINWDRIIFDEAHHLRNRNTEVHKAATEIVASHKWLVTGTPIQNGLTDFYGLCEVLGLNERYYTKKTNLKKIVERLILKRTKIEVGIQLPDLIKKTMIVPWESEEEKQLAEDIHYLLHFSHINNARKTNAFNNGGVHHFAMLQRAKQSCIDMGLMKENLEKLQDLNLLDEKLDLSKLGSFQSKINYVLNTIKENKNNTNKKLVFCHYRKEINKIAVELQKSGIKVGVFDGRTSIEDRKNLVNNMDIDVLVLQIQTGCEGLNLQQFNEIYFVSPHWNPAIEDQAIARCHRINQTKKVIVYIFKMESFDKEKQTRNIDIYVKDVQRKKRLEMKLIETEKEERALLDKENKPITCVICLEGITTRDNIKLDCGHYYHKSCLNEWFKKGEGCPTCRQ